MNQSKSVEIMNQSRSVFPGGVNSPVRSFASVGGTPPVFEKGKGQFLWDVDGNQYVDFCGSWGPLILGYSNEHVVKAIQTQAEKACSFGAPSELELLLGLKIKEFIPQMDMLRFVSSGTEATMSAIRAARAATGRNRFVKFEGCYHGHENSFLVKAGSGLATLGNTSSAGVPMGATQDTLVARFNSRESIDLVFEQYGSDIAAVIVEPVAANMGLVLPKDGFLAYLREVCDKHKTVLIFDEVMTGFRLAKGGAAEIFGVVPDMWTFGKIIGGGLPAAAYGGRRDIMENIAPLGKAYQAGTLSGNPLAMAAGLATLQEIERQGAYEKLETLGRFMDRIVQEKLGSLIQSGKLCYERIGSFFCFFFGSNRLPSHFQEVSLMDMDLFRQVYHAWLKNGIYLGPSGYEVGFLSTCIQTEEISRLVDVVFSELNK